MLHSHFKPLVPVSMPPMLGRQHYMHGFDLGNASVPEGFDDYLPVVKALCQSAGANDGKAYLTIDEKIVEAGATQRRPGPHVDGQYLQHARYWGHGWNHSCNGVPLARMPVIVAASAFGTRVWEGYFDIEPDEGGDLTKYHNVLGEGFVTEPHRGYWLSPDCVHESLSPVVPMPRSFLRIALPVLAA